MKTLHTHSLISTKEASELSAYNADYLSRLCREGKIEGQKVGRNWLVSRDSLETFMQVQNSEKAGRARTLSEQREREYMLHTLTAAPLRAPALAVGVPSISSPYLEAIRTPAGHLASGRIFRKLAVHDQAVAILVSLAALGGSFYGMQPGTASALADIAFSGATHARTEMIALSQTFNLQVQHYAQANPAPIAEVPTSLEVPPVLPAPELALPAVFMTSVANSENFKNSFYIQAQNGNQVAAADTALTQRPAHTEQAAEGWGTQLFSTYQAVGTYGVEVITLSLSSYNDLILQSASYSVAFASGLTDAISTAPYRMVEGEISLGGTLQELSAHIMDGYSNGIDAWIAFAPRIPGPVLGIFYRLGDGTATVIATGVIEAPGAYDRVIVAYVEAAPRVTERLARGEVAIGTMLNASTENARNTQIAVMTSEGTQILASAEALSTSTVVIGSGLAIATAQIVESGLQGVTQLASVYEAAIQDRTR